MTKKNKAKQALANMAEQMNTMMDAQVPEAPVGQQKHKSQADAESPNEQVVVAPSADAQKQSAESETCKGESKTNPPHEIERVSEEDTHPTTGVSIDKAQGNAIYSSLLGVQNTLDNFKLDVKDDSLREVVSNAIKEATKEYWEQVQENEKAEEERLRAEGKPANNYEAYLLVKEKSDNTLDLFNKRSKSIVEQFKIIAEVLQIMLGRINLLPLEKPKFKDENGKLLLQSLYLFPWYCCRRLYFSLSIRRFLKILAWSVWLIAVFLTCLLARDNAALHKYENIIRYERAYFSNNPDVMMELDGIDIMFGNDKVEPISVRNYRQYIKEREKETKSKR